MDMESMGEKCRIPMIQETPKKVDKSRISEGMYLQIKFLQDSKDTATGQFKNSSPRLGLMCAVEFIKGHIFSSSYLKRKVHRVSSDVVHSEKVNKD